MHAPGRWGEVATLALLPVQARRPAGKHASPPLDPAPPFLSQIGTLGPALCLWHLSSGAGAQQRQLFRAITALTAMMGSLGCCAGGFAAQHTDIATQYAGVLFGLTNAASSLAGSVAVYTTGVVLERTGGWVLVFQAVAAINLFSAAMHLMFSSSEPQFE